MQGAHCEEQVPEVASNAHEATDAGTVVAQSEEQCELESDGMRKTVSDECKTLAERDVVTVIEPFRVDDVEGQSRHILAGHRGVVWLAKDSRVLITWVTRDASDWVPRQMWPCLAKVASKASDPMP